MGLRCPYSGGAQDEAGKPAAQPYADESISIKRSQAAALAESLAKPLPWAVGFFFGNLELSLELWTVIAGISGVDE